MLDRSSILADPLGILGKEKTKGRAMGGSMLNGSTFCKVCEQKVAIPLFFSIIKSRQHCHVSDRSRATQMGASSRPPGGTRSFAFLGWVQQALRLETVRQALLHRSCISSTMSCFSVIFRVSPVFVRPNPVFIGYAW